MKFRITAKQVNYGYFEVEADDPTHAVLLMVQNCIEDDFVRESGEWVVEDPEQECSECGSFDCEHGF